MKGKTRIEKGITLIALIITIVVLLILAVVAISSITNDGILSYAQNAAKDYNQAVKDEQSMLDYYQGYLAGTLWEQNGTTITRKNEDGTIQIIEVGDYVNYVSGVDEYNDTNGWRVLGVENGKILLFSTDDVKASHSLSGTNGYYNGVSELNTICADYGNGKFAESARTVTVDDINRVTGYNPVTANYGSGSTNKYLNEVTYTLTKDAEGTVTGIAWTSVANSSSSTSYKKFMAPDGKRMMSDADWEALTDKTGLTRVDSVTVTSDYYKYYPNTLTTSSSGTTKGIATDSAAYLMLFKEATNTSTNTSYWLGSSYVGANAGNAGFGLRDVSGGNVNSNSLWNSDNGTYSYSSGVRAVVTLESDVKVTSAGANSWVLGK